MEITGPSRESLSAYFIELTDGYLLEVYNSRTLIDLAVDVAHEELTRRNILHASPMSMREENNEVQKPANDDSIVFETVARLWSTSQIEILRARLETEGIPAFVIDGGMSQLYSFISQPIGGARLQVLREYAREAREIIAAVNSGVLAATNQDIEK